MTEPDDDDWGGEWAQAQPSSTEMESESCANKVEVDVASSGADTTTEHTDVVEAAPVASTVEDEAPESGDDDDDWGDFNESAAPLAPESAPVHVPVAESDARSDTSDDGFTGFSDAPPPQQTPPPSPPPPPPPAPPAEDPDLFAKDALGAIRNAFAPFNNQDVQAHAAYVMASLSGPCDPDCEDASMDFEPAALAAAADMERQLCQLRSAMALAPGGAAPDSLHFHSGMPLQAQQQNLGQAVAAGGVGSRDGYQPVVKCDYPLAWRGSASEARLLAHLGLSQVAAQARVLEAQEAEAARARRQARLQPGGSTGMMALAGGVMASMSMSTAEGGLSHSTSSVSDQQAAHHAHSGSLGSLAHLPSGSSSLADLDLKAAAPGSSGQGW